VRALVLSNMLPDVAHPERGRFVRDQVAALRSLDGLDVELYEFPTGGLALAHAALDLRRRFADGILPGGYPQGGRLTRGRRAGKRSGRPPFDVVHAHFGLTAWPALAVPARVRALTVHGTDVVHPRSRLLTRAIAPRMDILAAVSAPLSECLPGGGARAQVLPCGVDLNRFHPIPRADARAELDLAPDEPFLLFAADPSRPEKRHDRALMLARAAGVKLRALGAVDPERVPLWVNASSAVLVPSEREGFGLVVLEALACNVPVLATPVGIHPDALSGVAGTLCAPFELGAWRDALDPHLRAADSRVQGRAHAERFSAQRMAARVAAAWRAALDASRESVRPVFR
jgi:teichuronic acid biosynthesis glycosyltransferase TuaC